MEKVYRSLERDIIKRYNGWENWETWISYTYFTNDENTYNYLMEEAEKYKKGNNVYPKKGLNIKILELADHLKEVFVEDKPNSSMPLYNELLQGAIDNISFIEISRHILTEGLCELEDK